MTQRGRDVGEQTTNFDKTESHGKYGCVGCQFNSDQALRLLCLKVHVRARGSTLWWHHRQEASKFLCENTSLGGIWVTKKITQNPGNALSNARLVSIELAAKLLDYFLWGNKSNINQSRFQRFAAGAAKKTTSARFFETMLRAVFIDQFINPRFRAQRFDKFFCPLYTNLRICGDSSFVYFFPRIMIVIDWICDQD